MYITEKIRVGGSEEIVTTFAKANTKFREANDLLQVINLKELELGINVNKTDKGLQINVALPGINDMTASLRCAINELEEVLELLQKLPEMAAGLKEKMNQPSNV